MIDSAVILIFGARQMEQDLARILYIVGPTCPPPSLVTWDLFRCVYDSMLYVFSPRIHVFFWIVRFWHAGDLAAARFLLVEHGIHSPGRCI